MHESYSCHKHDETYKQKYQKKNNKSDKNKILLSQLQRLWKFNAKLKIWIDIKELKIGAEKNRMNELEIEL
jgi:hypothetical protein